MPIFKSENNEDALKRKGVIILGCPRSGTTLLRRLLDSHPELSCPGETFLFRGAARFLKEDTISGGFPYGTMNALEGLEFDKETIKNKLRTFTTSFYEEIANREEKNIWVAKTAVDSFYIPEIESLFANQKNIKFICITRHGLDVISSLKEFSDDLQSYISELHYYIKEHQQPYEAFAHAWADVTKAIIEFSKNHPDKSHLVRYEDLVNDTDKILKTLTDFLEISPHPMDAESILQKNVVGGIGDWKSFKKTKIENTSIDRWKKDLSDNTVQSLSSILNPVLELANYEAIEGADNDEEKRRQEIAMMMMQAKGSD
jgi:hypothetical protein